jgi:hypothetical protein
MLKHENNLINDGICPNCGTDEPGYLKPIDDNCLGVQRKEFIRVVYQCDLCDSIYTVKYQAVKYMEDYAI